MEEPPSSWVELANGCTGVQQWGHPVIIVPHHRGQQLVVQHQTAPEVQLGLTRSPQGASQSRHVPSEDPSSQDGSSKCPRPHPRPQLLDAPGCLYQYRGRAVSHVPSNPLTGSGPCRR